MTMMPIDPNDAAAVLTSVWAYLQPYLAKARDKVVVDGLAGIPGKVWKAIRKRAQGTPGEGAVAKVEQEPNRPEHQEALRAELLRLLQYSAEFRHELTTILQQGDAYSHNVQTATDTQGNVAQVIGNQNSNTQF